MKVPMMTKSLKVRTGVRSGGWNFVNRCEKLSRSLKVRTGVRSGGWNVMNRCETIRGR